jgi:hypothetical protein
VVPSEELYFPARKFTVHEVFSNEKTNTERDYPGGKRLASTIPVGVTTSSSSGDRRIGVRGITITPIDKDVKMRTSDIVEDEV